MFQSALQTAIAKGIESGGGLEEELSELDDYVVKSKRDARAICQALSRLPREGASSEATGSDLEALCRLFQNVEDPRSSAFKVLSLEGHRQLFRVYDELVAKPGAEENDALMLCLKIFAMYGSLEGADKVVEAAKRPFNPESYFWSVIFEIFGSGHRHGELVFREVGDAIPPGFAGVTFMDGANSAMLEGDLKVHPYSSRLGAGRLRKYLGDTDSENYSYAVSAAVALAFVEVDDREELLGLVRAHPDPRVRIEGAWAIARGGGEAGLHLLAEYCKDPNQSVIAQRYLEELGSPELIPASAKEPEFLALAEFANWLSHPNELGRPPDELKVIDRRVLKWPPGSEEKPFTLMRYRLKDPTGLEADDVDCGLVGSMTWCFFSYRMNQRPPEDVYAIHCFWELENEELIVTSDEFEESEYDSLLTQWKGEALEELSVTCVADLSPKLAYPSRMVGVAEGRSNGLEGWVVLDDSRSKWYRKEDFPEETDGKIILKIHVGSHLLGFTQEPNRVPFLENGEPGPTPAVFVENYGKLLTELEEAAPTEVPQFLGSYQPLKRHFETYVGSLAETSGRAKEEILMETYEKILRKATQCEPSLHKEIFDCFSLPGAQFESYVEALIAAGRGDEVRPLIARFEPYWDHNLGHGLIGEAAFKIGDLALAEPHLVSVRKNLEEWGRSETMDVLAELWVRLDKKDEARDLLIQCMTQVAEEHKTSVYPSDRKRYREDFQIRRQTYLRLFPGGEDTIAKAGLPERLGVK